MSDVKKRHVTVQMPTGLMAEVDELIKNNSLGYRSRNEFCVEAVRLRVDYIKNNNQNNSE